MVKDPQKHYEELVKLKAELQTQVSRIQGRLDAAKADLLKIENECKAKGIDPNSLETLIEQIKTKYTLEAQRVEDQLNKLSQDLSKYQ